MQQQQFVIQDAYFDYGFMQIWMVSFLCPVYNVTGDLIGMVGTDMSLSQLYSLVEKLTSETEYSAFILEHNQNILAIEGEEYLGNTIENYTLENDLHELNNLIQDVPNSPSRIYSGERKASSKESRSSLGF